MNQKSFYAVALATLLLFAVTPSQAQVTERQRPTEWSKLVPGARFMDRFRPMEGNDLRSDVWGAYYVKPRFVDNGIEDSFWSYWGGNIVQGEDGQWHLFVAAWLEAMEKGHMEWHDSWVVHATAPTQHGPFRPQQIIGRGHNPEVYRTDDGTWVLYVIDGRYTAPSLNGPWTYGKFQFDPQGKPIIEGLSNLSFARKPEGGWLMVCRGGGIWESADGLTTWKQISDGSVYPKVDGRFEDPVLWRDSVQYNLIVNDWLGRIAYYLRSADGLHWLVDDGEAYMPGIARHADGSKEDWFKFERMRILQDKEGRAIQANFAVIDTIKWDDKPLDRHSSKNICIPLDPGLLLNIPANTKAKASKITVLIRAEKDFDPAQDLELSTLRCGAPKEVDYGQGAAPIATQKDGCDLLLTFRARDMKFTAEDFAAKVLVQRKDGSTTFGFARLPWYVQQ
ncbi:MAG: glycoside hydrolase family protein [Bacteroidaceae bacterium]|nr:glycoside hydrolase family protein [Bacteroidaceae bacterium]